MSTAPYLVIISVDHWTDKSERCVNWFWNLESWNAVFLYWNLTQWHVTLSVIRVYFNTGQTWDAAAPPASLLFILCFPHLCLCSSSSPYSSFSNPSAPGSVPYFYFVCSWTEMNKGKSNIKLCLQWNVYISSVEIKCVGWVRKLSVLCCMWPLYKTFELTNAVLRRARSFTSSADTVLRLPCLE